MVLAVALLDAGGPRGNTATSIHDAQSFVAAVDLGQAGELRFGRYRQVGNAAAGGK